MTCKKITALKRFIYTPDIHPAKEIPTGYTVRYQKQETFNDCGPACLVMLASHYHANPDITAVKRLCKLTLSGTNLERLLCASRELGFKAQAFKRPSHRKNLGALPFPCIAHIAYSWFGIKIKHYVVIAHSTEHHVEIWDPNPRIGIKKLTYTEFLSIWTGYLILITHS
jgi:ABC-type bacteriocin/lantibiotic exporter with double-glycine peptidase domain